MAYQNIINRLWDDFITQNQQAKKIYDLFTNEGETVVNDHIAFRTIDDPRVNIETIARPFLKAGYVEKGRYVFIDKHLYAKHFEHATDKAAPRIFISELLMHQFPEYLKEHFHTILNKIPFDILDSDEFIFSGNTWGQPSYHIYEQLRDVSEYAAWLYVFGFRINHFTVSVNNLKKFDTLAKVNQFIKDNGFKLNESGGEIKGNEEQQLEQSSTMADPVMIEFIEGLYSVPSCYYEFALRYPNENGELFSGFVVDSADKIFESTDNHDVN